MELVIDELCKQVYEADTLHENFGALQVTATLVVLLCMTRLCHVLFDTV